MFTLIILAWIMVQLAAPWWLWVVFAGLCVGQGFRIALEIQKL